MVGEKEEIGQRVGGRRKWRRLIRSYDIEEKEEI